MITERELSLTDYIIAHIRKELCLWFDCYGFDWGASIINGAEVFDGKSFLTLKFAKDRIRSSYMNVQLEYAGKWITVIAQLREDSRTSLTQGEFQQMVLCSVDQFKLLPESEQMARKVAILSMEIRYHEEQQKIKEWSDALCRDLTGKMRRFPDYQGTYANNQDMKVFEEPGVTWLQLDLSCRLAQTEIEARLERYLPGIRLQIGPLRQPLFKASNLLVSKYGIKGVGLLARKF